MKSILIIGLGRFGTHLCQDLARLDNEIMIVDKDEASLEDLLPLVVSAKIGDCTNEKVLVSETLITVLSVLVKIFRAVLRSQAC